MNVREATPAIKRLFDAWVSGANDRATLLRTCGEAVRSFDRLGAMLTAAYRVRDSEAESKAELDAALLTVDARRLTYALMMTISIFPDDETRGAPISYAILTTQIAVIDDLVERIEVRLKAIGSGALIDREITRDADPPTSGWQLTPAGMLP